MAARRQQLELEPEPLRELLPAEEIPEFPQPYGRAREREVGQKRAFR